jgi:HPr kinase/phosphorylase
MIQSKDFAESLQLKELSPSSRKEWDIRTTDLNRPGMQFCGFYEYFAYERPQVIGKVEMTYLEALEPETRRKMLKTYFSYNLPCVVICRGMMPPPDLIEEAALRDIAVYQTNMVTTKFTFSAINFLNRCLAPRITRHGVLVDVYGVGVLLTGESGVGKSEAALELVKRGHQLVADDVVDICRVNDERLTGEAPEMVRHFMEIRGIGIIDIRAMFGVGSVIVNKTIDLVMHMEQWNEKKEYDRLGLTEETITILGVKVPHQIMPVRPGRNLAIIIEVAARNLSLKRLGYSAAHELDRRMSDMIARNSGND